MPKPFLLHTAGGRSYTAETFEQARQLLRKHGGILKRRPNPGPDPRRPGRQPWPTILTFPAP